MTVGRAGALSSDFLRSPLARRIGAHVALVVLLAGVLLEGWSLFGLHRTLRAELVGDATMALRAAADERLHPTIQQLQRASDQLVRVSPIRGGTFFNAAGQAEASFGEPPELDWRDAALGGAGMRDAAGDRSDVFLSGEVTGLRYGTVLRLDTAALDRVMTGRIIRALLVPLLLAAVAGLAAARIAHRMAALPAARARAALRAALDAPEEATALMLREHEGHEVGDMGRALDSLLVVVEDIFGRELARAHALHAAMPMALLVYSPEGHLLHANPAALRLLRAKDEAALRARGDYFLQIEEKLTSPAKAVAGGLPPTPCTVLVGEEEVLCLAGGHLLRDGEEAPLGHFLTLCPIDSVAEELDRARRARAEAEQQVRMYEARTVELKELLNACVAIMSFSEGNATLEVAKVRPDMLIANWFQGALHHRQMEPKSVRHGYLPWLRMDEEAAARLIQSALAMVRLRARTSSPRITVRAKPAGATHATFFIDEFDPNGGRPMPADDAVRAGEAQVHVAAIARVASAAGGRLMSDLGANGGNGVVIRLPIDGWMPREGEEDAIQVVAA